MTILTKLNTVAASGASQTLAGDDGTGTDKVYDITLTANCTLSLSGSNTGRYQTVQCILRQDATAGRTVTLPSGVTWAGGAGPVLNQLAGFFDVIQFSTKDGVNWYGAAVSLSAAVPTAPAAPVVTALPGNQKLTVKLTGAAPAANGSPITGYNVYAAGVLAASNVALPYDLTGLTNGTPVSIQVSAVNGIEGAKSAATSYTPAVTPWTPAARYIPPAVYFDPLTSAITYGAAPAVYGIQDQGPNAYGILQATVANQPSFIAAGSSKLGTGPALRSAAAATSLKGYTGTTSPFTAITAGTGSSGSNIVNAGNLTELLYVASGQYSLVFGATAVAFTQFTADANPHLLEFQWDGTNVYGYQDGTLVQTVASTAPSQSGSLYVLACPPSTFPAYQPRLLSWNEGAVNWMNRSDGTRAYNGDQGTFLLSPSKDSASDQAFMEGYILWSYGLQANLPSGHAWKSAAPAR